MATHKEIELLTGVTDTQKKMLLVIADYNEGWITEQQLENYLKIILCK